MRLVAETSCRVAMPGLYRMHTRLQSLEIDPFFRPQAEVRSAPAVQLTPGNPNFLCRRVYPALPPQHFTGSGKLDRFFRATDGLQAPKQPTI